MLNRLHILRVSLHRRGLIRAAHRGFIGIVGTGGQGDEADGGETGEDKGFHAVTMQRPCQYVEKGLGLLMANDLPN